MMMLVMIMMMIRVFVMIQVLDDDDANEFDDNGDSDDDDHNICHYFDSKKHFCQSFLQLPSQEMWNGNITHVRIFCYKEHVLCSIKKVAPQPQFISFHALEREAVYFLQGEYCNSEGCSKKSSNLTIKSDVTIQSKLIVMDGCDQDGESYVDDSDGGGSHNDGHLVVE